MILYVTAQLGSTNIYKGTESGGVVFEPACGQQAEIYFPHEFSEIRCDAGSIAHVYGELDVVAESGSCLFAHCSSRIVAEFGAEVWAEEGSFVIAQLGSMVTALQGSQVHAFRGSHVKARCGSHIVCEYEAEVEEYGGCLVVDTEGNRVRHVVSPGRIMGR